VYERFDFLDAVYLRLGFSDRTVDAIRFGLWERQEPRNVREKIVKCDVGTTTTMSIIRRRTANRKTLSS